MTEYNAVLEFWFADAARAKWFAKDAAFDAEIHACFGATQAAAVAGALGQWEETPDAALALVILLDQFPRNMFRGRPAAFASDALALGVARRAIARDFDQRIAPERRSFFYLPFEHSEDLADQERSVELFATRTSDARGQDYARRHYDIVHRFGRFPHRNQILGRTSTAAEEAFLKGPGSSF
jgi:uncharacterized protein (DUF924 family)